MDIKFDLLLKIGSIMISPMRLTSYVYSHPSSFIIFSCVYLFLCLVTVVSWNSESQILREKLLTEYKLKKLIHLPKHSQLHEPNFLNDYVIFSNNCSYFGILSDTFWVYYSSLRMFPEYFSSFQRKYKFLSVFEFILWNLANKNKYLT